MARHCDVTVWVLFPEALATKGLMCCTQGLFHATNKSSWTLETYKLVGGLCALESPQSGHDLQKQRRHHLTCKLHFIFQGRKGVKMSS